MFLDLEVPPSVRPGVRPELLKALVDGVVCAFQTHLDQATVQYMASRIADEISVDPDDVTANLLASERAVCGARRQLMHGRRSRGCTEPLKPPVRGRASVAPSS